MAYYKSCIRGNKRKWLSLRYGKRIIRNLMFMSWPRFVGFDEPHIPQSFLKSAFEKAWEQDADILHATSLHKLRNDRDVNQWLIRQRQLAEGRFMPRSPKVGRVFDLDRDADAAADVIRRQAAKMVCLNDGALDAASFERIRQMLKAAFEAILPGACAFEKADR